MDVNEALMELEFEPDPAKLLQLKLQVDYEIERDLFDELYTLTEYFDNLLPDAQDSSPGFN